MRAIGIWTIGFIMAAGCGSGSTTSWELVVLTTGGGDVTASPGGLSGLSCGPRCRSRFRWGDTVVLAAVAAEGQAFLGWGGACAGTGECVLETGDFYATEVTATFGPPEPSWVVVVDEEAGAFSDIVLGASPLGNDGYAMVGGFGGIPLRVAAYDLAGTRQWQVKSSAGVGTSQANAVVAQPDGTVIVVGTFKLRLLVAGLEAFDPGAGAAFVLQLDPAGQGLVLESFPGGYAVDVARTSDAGFVVLGSYEQGIAIGPDMLVGAGETDVFVAKRGAGGWSSATLGSSLADEAIAVAEAADGRLWILAEFGGAFPTAAGTVGPGLAVVVLDGLLPVWTQTFGGEPGTRGGARGGGLVALPDGDMLVGATYTGSISIGASVLTSEGMSDWFVSRLQADGAERWSASHGGPGIDQLHGLAARGSLLYAGGVFAAAVDFGSGAAMTAHSNVPPNLDGKDGFVAAYDAVDGVHRWARRFGGWDFDPLLTVTASDAGVFAAGTMGREQIALGREPVDTDGCGVAVFFGP